MKKQILIAGLLMISAITFGQKKEIKNADKAVKSSKFSEAISYLKVAEPLITNADISMQEHYYFVKGKAYLGDAGNSFEKLNTAGDAFEKVMGLNSRSKYKDDVENGLEEVRVALINSAISDQKVKKNEEASNKLYRAYQLKRQDTSILYYAAGNAVNAKNYDKAIAYYNELVDINYTGIKREFLATNKETNEEEKFNSKTDRDEKLKTGGYIIPKERNSKSRRGDILRNMTLIYVNKGDSEKAATLMKKARKENPDDVDLMKAEADMYYKSGDMVSYKKIINEVISKNPNNPELYYNLGVASNKNGEKEAALEYYSKALELNPDYAEALINKSQLILNKEGAIVEEMNSLGTSTADYNRYDELKIVKDNLYKEAIPFLERASVLRPKNVELIRTLKNIYSQVGMDDKAKEMKSKLESLAGN